MASTASKLGYLGVVVSIGVDVSILLGEVPAPVSTAGGAVVGINS